jgi:hypothetical protein
VEEAAVMVEEKGPGGRRPSRRSRPPISTNRSRGITKRVPRRLQRQRRRRIGWWHGGAGLRRQTRASRTGGRRIGGLAPPPATLSARLGAISLKPRGATTVSPIQTTNLDKPLAEEKGPPKRDDEVEAWEGRAEGRMLNGLKDHVDADVAATPIHEQPRQPPLPSLPPPWATRRPRPLHATPPQPVMVEEKGPPKRDDEVEAWEGRAEGRMLNGLKDHVLGTKRATTNEEEEETVMPLLSRLDSAPSRSSQGANRWSRSSSWLRSTRSAALH